MAESDSPRKESKWACPNDPGLALLAKIGAGWSERTQHNQTYKPQYVTLDESEQQTTLEVVGRAEAMGNLEEEQVGRLVDRLDNMKRNAIGASGSNCVLCGAQCIICCILSTNSILCKDCKKTVCQNCGVETFSESRKEMIWRCKNCAETREMRKKPEAYKAVPKHVLPIKKATIENEFNFGSRIGLEKSTCSSMATMRLYEAEEESSSDDDRAPLLHASRKGRIQEQVTSSYSSRQNSQLSLLTNRGWPYSDRFSPSGRINAFKTGLSLNEESSEQFPHSLPDGSYEAEEDDDDSAPLLHASPSVSKGRIKEQVTSSYSSRQNSQLSLLTNRGWPYSDRFSPSGRINAFKTGLSLNEESSEQFPHSLPDADLGKVYLTVTYKSEASSIHVLLHQATNLKGMDIYGFADPFCKLHLLPSGTKSHGLRTGTHKSRFPEFNASLTFCGVTENDLETRSLHILILNDNKYGHDFMGEAWYPLHSLIPEEPKVLHLKLGHHYPVDNDEEAWREESWTHGQIRITLSFSTRKKALIVGIVRCTNLLPMTSKGFSDPRVQLYLRPDPHQQKYKTSKKSKNLNPVFNKKFVFKTKLTYLPQQTLCVLVWNEDCGKDNAFLGSLELSLTRKGERLRQWEDLIKSPDQKHVRWHNLCAKLPSK